MLYYGDPQRTGFCYHGDVVLVDGDHETVRVEGLFEGAHDGLAEPFLEELVFG